MKVFRVKNFERFQHYKDRSPPWIKLYNELLDDYEFGLLPDATKMHLIAIWLLASRSENKIPFDPKWVAGRINANDPVNLDILLERGFILLDQELQQAEHVAIDPLAECLPREENIEKRKEEREGERARPKIVSMGIGSEVDPEFQPGAEAIRRAHDQGATDEDIDSELRKFVAHYQRIEGRSANWQASWVKWWENWKPHKDKQAAKQRGNPRVETVMNQRTLTNGAYQPSEREWELGCQLWVKDQSKWSSQLGPDPNSLACRCPVEILQKHGLRPVPAEAAS